MFLLLKRRDDSYPAHPIGSQEYLVGVVYVWILGQFYLLEGLWYQQQRENLFVYVYKPSLSVQVVLRSVWPCDQVESKLSICLPPQKYFQSLSEILDPSLALLWWEI